MIRWGFAIGGIAGVTSLAAPETSHAAGPRAEARRAARLANQQGVPVTPWQPTPISGGQVFEPYPGVRITVSPPGSPLPYGPSATQGYTPNGGFPGGSYPSTGYPAPVVIDPYTGLPITNQVVPVQGQVQAPLNQTPLTPIPEGIGSPVTTYSGPNSVAAPNPAPANPAANNAVGPDGRPLTPAQKRRRDRMGNGGTADIASRSTGDQPTPLSPDDGFSTSNFNG
ncbi:MAG: hypothetical protein C0478_18275, partial [Planctomyces sp.]|nr:hypothetical protein [Planctomyces sp.]